MKTKLSVPILAAALLIGACAPAAPAEPTPDIVSIRTSAAETVVAEITLTAAAFTATPSITPTEEILPTNTVIPGVTETPAVDSNGTPLPTGTAILCDHMNFDPGTVDVNIPDNTEMTPNQEFVKTWKIKNDGGCAWGAGYGLTYAGYTDRMSGQPQPLSTVVSIGQEVEVSVSFKAPSEPGEYLSAWQMVNERGIPFPKVVFVKVVVR